MRFDFNKKNTTIVIYACIVVLFAVVLVFAFINLKAIGSALWKLINVLYPVIYGLVIAYLINPIYKIAYQKIFFRIGAKKNKKRMRTALSLVCTYAFVFLLIFLFFMILVPQLISSYSSLIDLIKNYVNDASAWVNELLNSSEFSSNILGKLFSGFSVSEITSTVQKIISESYGAVTTITPYLISFVSSFVTVAKNWSIGIIISIYMLASKDILCAQIEKTVTAFLKPEKAKKLTDFAFYVDKTFGQFLLGKIFDSLIIGVLTFIVMSACRMPYSPLISVIIGVTNVIPFFGPFIGAIPSIFIVLIADPIMAIWALLIIIVIQQIDGNIIGPKIIGNTTGISSLWIVVSIIVFGGMFGIIGMIVAVPLFSILYKLFKDHVEGRLVRQGLSDKTADYLGSLDGEKREESSGKNRKE